jgi:hypothetical protein
MVWKLIFIEDLIVIINEQKQIYLDVGWYPHAKPQGRYRIEIGRMKMLDHKRFDPLGKPIDSFESRSLKDVIDRIRQTMGAE